MRAVIQRVQEASVTIDNKLFSSISKGLLVFIGIEDSDSREDIEWLSGKIIRLRIFNDSQGVMNLSTSDIGGEILIISQFTLHASTRKGNRPSYIRSSKPERAIPIYEDFVSRVTNDYQGTVKTGLFGADMKIKLLNDGPVTLFMDTKNKE